MRACSGFSAVAHDSERPGALLVGPGKYPHQDLHDLDHARDPHRTARKHLAQELHYQGDMKNSAKMNVWLHKQVMLKFAENGGKVPDELKH